VRERRHYTYIALDASGLCVDKGTRNARPVAELLKKRERLLIAEVASPRYRDTPGTNAIVCASPIRSASRNVTRRQPATRPPRGVHVDHRHHHPDSRSRCRHHVQGRRSPSMCFFSSSPRSRSARSPARIIHGSRPSWLDGSAHHRRQQRDQVLRKYARTATSVPSWRHAVTRARIGLPTAAAPQVRRGRDRDELW